MPFEREKQYTVQYKAILLPHHFYADFVVFDEIILEVKCVSQFTPEFTAHCINYLKVSGNQWALLVNFGEMGLNYKRIAFYYRHEVTNDCTFSIRAFWLFINLPINPASCL